ncbi:MAG: VIT domain-containing protein [Propionicimonas sp.]
MNDQPQALDEAGASDPHAGLAALATERGNLPLQAIDAQISITGLVSRTMLTQVFRNPHGVPLEATYIFPLPDRAAVTALTLTADGRTVVAELDERGRARQAYDEAIAAGQRAAIAEQERPDVFTMRVGNILPGEEVSVALTLVGPLAWEDGEATYRLPLVVAPRYIPGLPIGTASGDGYAPDTDAVPDASRITPAVLLPGFPNPVRLSIGVDVDPAGLPAPSVRSSLHTIRTEGGHLRIEPGERVNRDFILRLGYGTRQVAALTLSPDAEGGTFQLTVLPPEPDAPRRPRDVVLVLDRSGSMGGWKMVAARRAAARIVDTLTSSDRFAVLAFDHRIERPERLGAGLAEGSDRNRFAAIEFLARLDAAGGTEILHPLREALGLLDDASRDRSVVLVTDGQVGNEDEILAAASAGLGGARIHTVGVDQAVNAGFLGRLAALGAGRCELVESEDRLDEAMDQIHRRVSGPIVTGLSLAASGLSLVADSVTPARVPDVYLGVPLVVAGRYVGVPAEPVVTLAGRTRAGESWRVTAPGTVVADPATTAVWARAHVRDLEDQWASLPGWEERAAALKNRIIDASLRFGVLSRFTAWVAVDERVVAETGEKHRVLQPVELPAGWEADRAMPLMAGAPMPAPAPMGATPAAGRSILAGTVPGARRLSARSAKREVQRPRADESSQLRAFAKQELARLREAADLADYERREYLADLRTRLVAILTGLITADAGPLGDLRDALADDEVALLGPDGLDVLWDRVTALLESVAEGR